MKSSRDHVSSYQKRVQNFIRDLGQIRKIEKLYVTYVLNDEDIEIIKNFSEIETDPYLDPQNSINLYFTPNKKSREFPLSIKFHYTAAKIYVEYIDMEEDKKYDVMLGFKPDEPLSIDNGDLSKEICILIDKYRLWNDNLVNDFAP